MGIFNNQQPGHDPEQPLHIFDKTDCGKITNYCELCGVSAQRVIDAVKLGSWAEVEKLQTENEPAADKLDGLIIKGYETKFGKTNENGERYDKSCLDEFIEQYYIKNKLNIPVTIQHRDDIRHLCGRVLLVEVNSVGFYFVVYVPRTYRYYADVLNAVREGILQGLSKEGYVCWEDFIPHRDKNDDIEYWEIRKFRLTAMSIVATPANGVPFEKVQQIKNTVQFHKTEDTTPKDNAAADPLQKMFH